MKPPRLAQWIVRATAPVEDAAYVLGDLAEEFERRAAVDRSHAVIWYWRQTVRSAWPLLRWNLLHADHQATPYRGDGMLTGIAEDVRSALRTSRRSMLTTAAVVLTIVLGIGATTAAFSVVNAVLVRPLPFAESGRVAELGAVVRGRAPISSLAHPDLIDYRSALKGEATLAIYSTSQPTIQHGERPRALHAVQADGEYATVFGVHMQLGRFVGAQDAVYGTPRVVVLSNRFWRSEFAADSGVVGKTLTLNNNPYQVIGVLGAGTYSYPVPEADIVTPLILVPGDYTANRGAMWARAAIRLNSGVTYDQAQQTITRAASAIAHDFAASNAGITARIVPLHDAVVGPVQGMLLLLTLTVAAVLLIAAVNVGNLLLARAESRAREFAVRSALGGSPSRLRRQILTESLLLSAIGGCAGLALAPLLVRGLVAIYPTSLPRASEIGVDLRVVGVASLLILFAGLLSGMPAARRLMRLDLANDLRDRSAGSGARMGRGVSQALVVAQVATSLALLVSAGLLVQTFRGLNQMTPGFNAASVTTFHVVASGKRHPDPADVDRFYTSLLDSMRAVPGVLAAAATNNLPFSNSSTLDTWLQTEVGEQGPGKDPQSDIAIVTPGFDRALGLPLIKGRFFDAHDDSTSARVVIINQATATRYYAGVDPIGRTISWGFGGPWRIVGVVGSTHSESLSDEAGPVLYAPSLQAHDRSRSVVVRSTVPPGTVVAAALSALRSIDPTVAITDVHTMDERVAASLAPQRFRALMVSGLSVLALVLALIGLYGVVSYSVNQRTREIGIRLALGESALGVRARIVGAALLLALIGSGVGIGLSFGAAGWLRAFLVGVDPHDGKIVIFAAALLILVVGIAADAPARRASRVDPLVAMRDER